MILLGETDVSKFKGYVGRCVESNGKVTAKVVEVRLNSGCVELVTVPWRTAKPLRKRSSRTEKP